LSVKKAASDAVCAWRKIGVVVSSTFPEKSRAFPIVSPRYERVNSIRSLERGGTNAVVVPAVTRVSPAVVVEAGSSPSSAARAAGTARRSRKSVQASGRTITWNGRVPRPGGRCTVGARPTSVARYLENEAS
jgi:hypothetical protein